MRQLRHQVQRPGQEHAATEANHEEQHGDVRLAVAGHAGRTIMPGAPATATKPKRPYQAVSCSSLSGRLV